MYRPLHSKAETYAGRVGAAPGESLGVYIYICVTGQTDRLTAGWTDSRDALRLPLDVDSVIIARQKFAIGENIAKKWSALPRVRVV